MDSKKLFTDFSVSLIRKGVTIVRGFIMIPLLTKLLGTDAYGLWASILGLVTIASGVGSFDFSSALIRYTPEEDISGQTFVDLTVLTGASAVVTGGLFVVVDTVVGILPPGVDSGNLLVATVALIVAYSLQNTVRNYPKAQNRVKFYELIHISQIVLEILALVIAIFLTNNIIFAFWSIFGVAVVVNSGIIVATLLRQQPRPNSSNFKKYITFSLPMAVQTFMGRSIRNIDKYLLLILASPTAVGVYAVSSAIGQTLENIAQALNPTLYPAVVRAWRDNEYDVLSDIYQKIIRWFVILGVPAVTGLTILASPLLVTLSTDAIAKQGRYLLPILAIAFVISTINGPLVFIIQASERTESLMKIYTVGAVVNVIINLLAIPRYGSLGAAVATLLTYVVITAYIYIWVKKRIPLSLPIKTTVKSVFSAGVMTSCLLAIPPLFELLQIVIYPIVGAVVYLVTMVVIRGISREEVFTIKNTIRKYRAEL